MWKKVSFVVLLLVGGWTESIQGQDNDHKEESFSAKLFEPVPKLKRVSPSHYPKPYHLYEDPDITSIVDPSFGKHRHDQDAVFAMAEGYDLKYYIAFLKTMEETGFTGDVVLYVSEPALIKDYVTDYLREERPMNVVVYDPELSCFDQDLNRIKRRETRNGAMDIFQMCELDNVYGYRDKTTGEVVQGFQDLREGRVMATLRYEWYWIWSQFYDPNVWIMLIDSRDTIFQSNPFVDLPRQPDPDQTKDGLLYLFGENHEATRLGRSVKNRNWLKNGYGNEVITALTEKPTICSGSTMGEQIALDNYLRAMVNEWDETDIAMTGSDQGFHNYLYYTGKLNYVEQIRKVIVWEQGKGIINNLGALRTKTLQEWGIYDPETHVVTQWDKTTPSPVCHQWDRDEQMHTWLYKQRMRDWSNDYKAKLAARSAGEEVKKEQ